MATVVRATGSLSPVSVETSSLQPLLSMTRMSAGTQSPIARCTMSPTTSDSEGTLRTRPPRSTRDDGLSIFWKAAMMSALRFSCATGRRCGCLCDQVH